MHWNTEHSTVADDGERVQKVQTMSATEETDTPRPLSSTLTSSITPNTNHKQAHGIPIAFLPASVLPYLSPHPRCFRLLLAGGVVPPQTALWLARCPNAQTITTDDTLPPNGGAYSGLGVDRALALRGAGEECGWPCMVIDVGTALTFTVADVKGRCAGGAICPGLRLALQSLAQRTALLPEMSLPTGVDEEGLLPLFGVETGAAIQAGVLHGVRVCDRRPCLTFVGETCLTESLLHSFTTVRRWPRFGRMWTRFGQRTGVKSKRRTEDSIVAAAVPSSSQAGTHLCSSRPFCSNGRCNNRRGQGSRRRPPASAFGTIWPSEGSIP